MNDAWTIGARGNGVERFFQGAIDELAIYSRTLSAEEVMAHFIRGKR